MSSRTRLIWGATLGSAALLLTGCAGAPSGDAGATAAPASSYDCATPDAGSAPTQVSVSAQPIVSNGALYAGVDEGFFAKHGLELDIQPVANVAASIASVQGGTSDFGFATTVSILQAVDNSIPIKAIAPFAGIAPNYYDKMQAGEEGFTTEITALVVSEDSGITSPKELEGRTVAVADAMGQSELTTRYVIDEDGGDTDAVQYTVMSFPDAVNAFTAGQIDAMFTVEPFLSEALDAGGEIISWPGVETFHDGPTSAIIASTQFIEDKAETVTRMNCALRESNAFANENQDVIRAAVATAQDVDPATLADAVVPYFYTTTDLAGLDRFSGIMYDFGFIKNEVPGKDIVTPEALAD